jgi:hypothetical protein
MSGNGTSRVARERASGRGDDVGEQPEAFGISDAARRGNGVRRVHDLCFGLLCDRRCADQRLAAAVGVGDRVDHEFVRRQRFAPISFNVEFVHQEHALVEERIERDVAAVGGDERDHADGHRFTRIGASPKRTRSIARRAMHGGRADVSARGVEAAQAAMRGCEAGVAREDRVVESCSALGFVERDEIGEIRRGPVVLTVGRHRAFEDGARIEAPSAAREEHAVGDQRFCMRGRGGEDVLEHRERVVETTVIAQERRVIEARVERLGGLAHRRFEVAQDRLARVKGGPGRAGQVRFRRRHVRGSASVRRFPPPGPTCPPRSPVYPAAAVRFAGNAARSRWRAARCAG